MEHSSEQDVTAEEQQTVDEARLEEADEVGDISADTAPLSDDQSEVVENPGSDEVQSEENESSGDDETELEEADESVIETPTTEETSESPEEVETDTSEASSETILTDSGEVQLVHDLEYAPVKEKDKDADDSGLEIRNVAEARAILEALLFATTEPLSVGKISKLMNNLHTRTVRGLLVELQLEYESRGGALQVVEVAGGFQIGTRPHFADWIFRMQKHRRRNPLSPATLETLAIIAYKQPVTKAEIETIRGVESTGPLRNLQELNLVEVGGRREVLGRPQIYVTTEQFLKTFGLKSLADLPSIQELKHLFAEEQKLSIKKAEAPVATQPEGEATPEELCDASQAESPEPLCEVEETVGGEISEESLTETAESEIVPEPELEQPEEGLGGGEATEEACPDDSALSSVTESEVELGVADDVEPAVAESEDSPGDAISGDVEETLGAENDLSEPQAEATEG